MEEDLSKPIAKALLTVASFDALVLTVLQYRSQRDFLEEVLNNPKNVCSNIQRVL